MKKSNFSKNIAYGGIFTALSVILLYLTAIIPINKFFLLGLASCIVPMSILTTSIKNSFIIYLAVSILSFFLITSKTVALAYIFLFGLYGFIKLFIEKLTNTLLEIVLKLSFFNVITFTLYSLYKNLFIGEININLPIYALVIVAQLAFIVYDYALTVFINYSLKNILPKLK